MQCETFPPQGAGTAIGLPCRTCSSGWLVCFPKFLGKYAYPYLLRFTIQDGEYHVASGF